MPMPPARVPDPTVLPAIVTAAKALAHPGRLRILAMLRSGDLCVCQLTAVLGLAASTVSAHLSELKHAGLVTERKQAKWVFYALSRAEGTAALLGPWFQRLEADSQQQDDARVVRALRAVPVETLCQVGLSLDAAGVTRVLRRRGRDRTARPRSARPGAARRGGSRDE